MSAQGERVRAATPEDLPELCLLVGEYWDFEAIDGFDPHRVGASLGRLLDCPVHGRAWLAQGDGGAAGYLVLVFVFSLEHGGMTAEIDELYVRSAYRGRGLGRLLLQRALDACRDAGCHNISLQLGRENRRARRFYLARGFRRRDGYHLLEREVDLVRIN